MEAGDGPSTRVPVESDGIAEATTKLVTGLRDLVATALVTAAVARLLALTDLLIWL